MAYTFNTNLKNAAAIYAELLGVRITGNSLRKSIEENPHYPSMLSLNDTFSRFNIVNNGYEVPVEQLEKIPAPFIAMANMPGTGKDFVVVTAINEKYISYVHKGRKKETIQIQEFRQLYQGAILFAEPDEQSGELHFEVNKRKERLQQLRKTIWIAGFAAMIVVIFIMNFPVQRYLLFSLLTLLKLGGIAVSVMLLLLELGQENAFVKSVCSALKKTNCEAVLKSKAAKIAGLSWAEIGLFYFASTAIFMLVPGINFETKALFVTSANLPAVAYVPFSIYYQWKIVKSWCPLCLVVQFILVSEFIAGAFFLSGAPVEPLFSGVTLSQSFTFVIAVLLPLLIWFGIKIHLIKSKEHDLYAAAYRRIQYNPDIFNQLLEQQPAAAAGFENLGIDLGNPLAANTIIKVCNPYCGPCASAHPKLEHLIRTNKNIRLKIIFTPADEQGDARAEVVRHLMAINTGERHDISSALDGWYMSEDKNFSEFSVKFPAPAGHSSVSEQLTRMHDWCNKSDITHTPTIFVNGHRLPENYKVEELENILQG